MIGGGVLPEDRDTFFGPLQPTDEFFELSDNATWADALKTAGLFKSKTRARKNGWGGPIPDGFSHFDFGKLHHDIAALKILQCAKPS